MLRTSVGGVVRSWGRPIDLGASTRPIYGWLANGHICIGQSTLPELRSTVLLSARRDADAAKRILQKALRSPDHPRPRVINVDRNPAYPKAIEELKRTGELGRRCRCRPVRYLNNIVEQDHRSIKRRVRASQGFRSFHSAARTLEGMEMVNMICKGQVGWLAQGDVPGQVAFMSRLFKLQSSA